MTADVIDVTPQTPGLDAMLAKFSREHWHDEDEVRFILRGRGHLPHPPARRGRCIAIEVGPGDLIRVPRGTWHWFDLCADRDIRAIRLFQDASGWTPHYTESGVGEGLRARVPGAGAPARGRRLTLAAAAAWRRGAARHRGHRPRRSRSSTTCCSPTRGSTCASFLEAPR